VSEELFETLDLLAEWRLRDSKTLCRLAEVKRLGDRQEVAKMTKLNLIIHISMI
jgi:hypothetical protein